MSQQVETAPNPVRVREVFEACIDVDRAEREVLGAALAGNNLDVLERAMQLLDAHDALATEVSFEGPSAEQLALAALHLESLSDEGVHEVDPGLVGTLRAMRAELGLEAIESRYRLGETLATGGMGEIREAHDSLLNRGVAAKVLRNVEVCEPLEQLSGRHAWRIRRFLTEIEITADLQHPSIPPIYSRGLTGDGALLFTMPQLPGKDLAQTIRDSDSGQTEGRNRLLRILCSVGDALAFAHSRGIIHRDLKPANVIVGDLGEIYLIDWGLARRLDSPSSDADAETEPGTQGEVAKEPEVTQTARALGTLSYMPPEQSGALRVPGGVYSDVYSLGASTAHVLLGEVPTVGLGELGEELEKAGQPAELVAIVRKATAFRPEDRYASIQELVIDLRAAMDHRVVQAHATGPWTALRKWARRNPATAAAVGALTVAIFAATGFYVRALQIEQQKTKAHLESTRRVADCLTAVLQDLDIQKGEKSTILAKDLFGALQRRMDMNLGHPDDLPAYLRWSAVNAQNLLSIGENTYAKNIGKRIVERSVETGTGTSNIAAVGREVVINSLIRKGTAEAADEAEKLIEESLEAWSRSDRSNIVWKLNCLGQLATIKQMRGDREGYRASMNENLAALRELTPGSMDEAIVRSNLLIDRLRADEHEDAIDEARALLDYVLGAEWGGPDHSNALFARGHIVSCLVTLERKGSTETEARELVKDSERLFGEGALQTNINRRYLAFAIVNQDHDRIEEAQEVMDQAFTGMASFSTPNYKAQINTLGLQFALWEKVGQPSRGLVVNKRAMALAEEHFEPLDKVSIGCMANLCESHYANEDFAESDARLRSLIEMLPADRAGVAYLPLILHLAARTADALGDRDRGEAHWLELLECPGTAPEVLAQARERLSK